LPEQFFQGLTPIASGNRIYLERPRIDRLLKQAVNSPLVIVVAGAGYGKTHAVYSFVQKCNALTVWVQLSERDNISERFWENVVSATASVSRDSAVKLTRLGFPVTAQQFERYFGIIRNDAAGDKKYILVYDDLHLITNKAVLRFLEYSVSMPCPNITSVFISRTEPGLNLTKRAPLGFLNHLTEEHLRFSYEEMVLYFRLQNIAPSPRTAASIYHDTEGWAFAIHLAGLSLKNAPAGAVYIPQTLRVNIFKLIESEIMQPLEPELRRFLIKLSLIEHLDPALLRGLAADPSLMDGLENIGVFIRFDAYFKAYRIHHLFLDYLKGRQDELSEDEKKEVWAETADWCAANNQKMDAISYYEKAGLYGKLLELAVHTLPLLLPDNTARMLLEIMDRAPKEIYSQYPVAPGLHCRLLFTLEMMDEALADVKQIIAVLEKEPLTPGVHRILAGCYNNWGFINMYTAMYTRNYDYPAYFEKARFHAAQINLRFTPPMNVSPQSAYICRVKSPEREEMEQAITALEKSIPHLVVSMGGCMSGIYELARGELAFFRGEPEAEPLLRESVCKAREYNQYEIENRALFYLLRISLREGAMEGLMDILKQLKAQLEEPGYLNRYTYDDIVMGWFYVQIRQGGKAAKWLKNDFEECVLNSASQGLEILVKAKYQISEKQYRAALVILGNRDKKYGIWAFVMGKIEILTLEALCRWYLEEKERAYDALEAAWKLAEPNGLFFPFAELGAGMQSLTEGALKDGTLSIPQEGLEKINRDAARYGERISALAGEFGSAANRR
jgi:LuxR family maltose regulon positive regulatory protein